MRKHLFSGLVILSFIFSFAISLVAFTAPSFSIDPIAWASDVGLASGVGACGSFSASGACSGGNTGISVDWTTSGLYAEVYADGYPTPPICTAGGGGSCFWPSSGAHRIIAADSHGFLTPTEIWATAPASCAPVVPGPVPPGCDNSQVINVSYRVYIPAGNAGVYTPDYPPPSVTVPIGGEYDIEVRLGTGTTILSVDNLPPGASVYPWAGNWRIGGPIDSRATNTQYRLGINIANGCGTPTPFYFDILVPPPDLTARTSAVPPTLTRGNTVVFEGNLDNNSPYSITNASFDNRFEVTRASDGSLVRDVISGRGPYTVGPNGGASPLVTGSYPIPQNLSAGDYRVRLCADEPGSEVNESDNANNCGNSQTFTILPQCSDGVDNDGDSFGDHPQDLGCINPSDDDESDDSDPGGSSSTPPPPAPSGTPPDLTLTGTPRLVDQDDTATLTSTVDPGGGTSGTCTVAGTDGSVVTVNPAGTQTFDTNPLQNTTSFTLTCTGGGTPQTVIIRVNPRINEE